MNDRLVGERWLRSPEKRRMDVAIALGAVPLAALPIIVASAGLTLGYRQSPLFWQNRLGRVPTTLSMCKLRTLAGVVDDGHSERGFDHDRANAWGRAVRRLHVDELPQLLHVITGDMSVVGPRPVSKQHAEIIKSELTSDEFKQWARARQMAKPGVVNGYSAQQHTPSYALGVREMVEADITYADQASPELDTHIIASTAATVIAHSVRALGRITEDRP